MRWFYNLKIGTKIIAGFIIVAIISGVVGIIGMVNINKINSADTELYKINTLGLSYIGNAEIEFQKIRVNIIYLTGEYGDKEKYSSQIEDSYEALYQNLEKYAETNTTEEEIELFDQLKSLVDQYKSMCDQVVELVISDSNSLEISSILNGASHMAESISNTMDNLYDLNEAEAKQKSESNDATARGASASMITVIMVAIIAAISLGVVVSKVITNPIKHMVNVADVISQGDLDVIIEIYTKDEVGRLAAAFRKMSDNLNDVISNIAAASEQVAAGSNQISDSSIALAHGATEQASSVEELTASLEEISVQTKQNAKNADEAKELAELAESNALKGNLRMEEMLRAMEEINDSSSNISRIIKVIDEIAFQTNILALNAAVEAARAGQHGKGFAVVAEEVRNLAARSANAAQETTDMIEGSIRKVEEGARIANETAVALVEIVDEVAKTALLVGEIAVASNEQAIGIAQINQGVMQVSQVVQSNSATSEESAAASEELSSQAVLLKDMASRFKLKQDIQPNAGLEDLKPEVFQMLNRMTKNEENSLSLKTEPYEEVVKSKTIISLSDKEFGKY